MPGGTNTYASACKTHALELLACMFYKNKWCIACTFYSKKKKKCNGKKEEG